MATCAEPNVQFAEFDAAICAHIAAFCPLRTAGYLSVMNRSLYACVTPVLHEMVDVNDLWLVYADTYSEHRAADTYYISPVAARDMVLWGVCYGQEQHINRPEWQSTLPLKDMQYWQHIEDIGEEDLPVMNTIFRDAMPKLSGRAHYAARTFVRKHIAAGEVGEVRVAEVMAYKCVAYHIILLLLPDTPQARSERQATQNLRRIHSEGTYKEALRFLPEDRTVDVVRFGRALLHLHRFDLATPVFVRMARSVFCQSG